MCCRRHSSSVQQHWRGAGRRHRRLALGVTTGRPSPRAPLVCARNPTRRSPLAPSIDRLPPCWPSRRRGPRRCRASRGRPTPRWATSSPSPQRTSAEPRSAASCNACACSTLPRRRPASALPCVPCPRPGVVPPLLSPSRRHAILPCSPPPFHNTNPPFCAARNGSVWQARALAPYLLLLRCDAPSHEYRERWLGCMPPRRRPRHPHAMHALQQLGAPFVLPTFASTLRGGNAHALPRLPHTWPSPMPPIRRPVRAVPSPAFPSPTQPPFRLSPAHVASPLSLHSPSSPTYPGSPPNPTALPSAGSGAPPPLPRKNAPVSPPPLPRTRLLEPNSFSIRPGRFVSCFSLYFPSPCHAMPLVRWVPPPRRASFSFALSPLWIR